MRIMITGCDDVRRSLAAMKVCGPRARNACPAWPLLAISLCLVGPIDHALAGAANGAVPMINPVAAVPLSQMAATSDRPLFSPTRRPPEPAPQPAAIVAVAMPAPPPAPPAPVPFTLVGTMTSATLNVAFLRNETTGDVVALKPGDVREGWTVGEIGRRTVRLARDTRSEEIALQDDQSGSASRVAELPPPADPVPAPVRSPDTAMAQPGLRNFGLPSDDASVTPPG